MFDVCHIVFHRLQHREKLIKSFWFHHLDSQVLALGNVGDDSLREIFSNIFGIVHLDSLLLLLLLRGLL